MRRKPRFKLQFKNLYDESDFRAYGRKQWLKVYAPQGLGFTLTFEEATALYWEMSEWYPEVTYRIVEKR